MGTKTEKMFELLFDINDKVLIGRSLFDTSLVSRPAFTGPQFFVTNPLHGSYDFGHDRKPEYKEHIPRRADINVTRLRNFMFEMDNLALSEQREVLAASNIPWTSVVFSGSKVITQFLVFKNH